MSSVRRKARVIQTLDDDPIDAEESKNDEQSHTSGPIKFGRKPNKSSSLRKSINFADDHGDGRHPAEDDDEGSSVVIRPSISRAGSTKQRKKPASSRLSFGPGAADEDDGATTTSTPTAAHATSTPSRKPLAQKAAENNALKIKLPSRVLGGEEDRPRYSKDYLAELQSSTPHTPQDMSSLSIADDQDVQMAMDIDPSELEGATIVPTPSQDTSSTTLTTRTPAAMILTAAQIQEKKDRRARLAAQAAAGGGDDYIALSGSEDEDADDRLINRTKKKETRLVREDEDLGEGFDVYVEDGGLALGKAAERKAKSQKKKEMAELIASAEAPTDEEDVSDDSLEARGEYEAAQRRKGMGVEMLDDEAGDGVNFIPKMRPLPDLNESLQRMRSLVQALDDDVAQRRARIAALKKEREEIARREEEVQGILNQAGAKYQAVLGSNADAAKVAAQSPLRVQLPPGLVPEVPVERGLESFGTTPVGGRDEYEDEVMEYDP